MPQRKPDHEQKRLKNARLKKLSLLPKRFKRPTDPEQAREWLRQIADKLSNSLNAGPPSRFVAYAIKKYLRRPKAVNLARELGLIYTPGRPRTFKERTKEKNLARRTHELIRAGKNRNQIAKQLVVPYRTLTRIYTKYLPEFKKEDVVFAIGQHIRKYLHSQRKHS